jgi:predicted PurR-regulated permease PerM
LPVRARVHESLRVVVAADHRPIDDDAAAPASHIRVVVQLLAIVAGTAAALWTLHRLAAVVLVLLLAGVFAYVVAPLVTLAERPIRLAGRTHRLKRAAAVALVYVLMIGGVSASVALLAPSAATQMDDMIASAPAYAQSIVTWQHGWSRYYERMRIPRELRQAIDGSVTAANDAAIAYARGAALAIVGTLTYLPWIILIPILAFFLLKDATSIRRAIVVALPHRIQLRGHRLFEELNAALAAYVRAQLLACLLVGTACGLGFAVIGIPYPVLLGVLAGILEFIPLVGPLVLAIVACTVGALHGPAVALRAAGFLAVLRVIEDYMVYPRLIRRGIELHPLAVIVAVLAGAELYGVAGMFLAVPTVAIGAVVCRHWLGWRVDSLGPQSPVASDQ